MEIIPTLPYWPAPIKKLVFTFVLIAFVGVVFGGVMIEVTTHLTPQGVIHEYKGMKKSEMSQAKEMKFPKSAKEMLITTHNHILGLSSLFLIIGFLYLSAVDETGWLQVSVAVEPLISLVVTFGGLWIVRYLWPPFVYVVILSGTLMIATFGWMCLVVMKNCITKPTVA